MTALAGKVALVTGAGQGLGFEIATAMARAGAALVLVERYADRLEASTEKLRELGAQVASMVGDVRERDVALAAAEGAVQRFGRLDVLVNNAQILTPPMPFIEQDDAYFDRAVRSGLYGTIYFMQACYPALSQRGGAVINLGSGAGTAGNVGQAAYGAAKEAIRGLSRTVAREWGKDNIRINVICPTANSPSYREWFKDKPELQAASVAHMARGRPAEGFEIGNLAVFLASDACTITGQTLHIDGGSAMP
jgi:NAD(P)-dependent dehydrogenase (short-subunit alcohol dehydrogenase family)